MYVQQLEKCKHDIAERHVDFRRLVNEVLCDGQQLCMSCHSKANPVKVIYMVIDHCLQSEKRAERFLKVLRETNPVLYADLTTCGPQGKYVRAAPPAVEITNKAQAALGERVEDLQNMMTLPFYTMNITNIWPILDTLMAHGQLLPEEHEEFMMNRDDRNVMVKQLEYLCRHTSIPEGNRRFISLVAASCNMHVFGILDMSTEDVLVFA